MNNEKIAPVKSYVNVADNKSLIYKENKNRSGIYLWNNLITSKSYIGSSVNLKKRIADYLSLQNLNIQLIRNRSLIYSAILKYGIEKFQLHILEYCDKDILLKREQYYIDTLKPKYNLLTVTVSRLGVKHTKESIKKISESKKYCVSSFLGKNHTSESKLEISNRNSKYVKVIDTYKNTETIFLGAKKVCEYLKIKKSWLAYSKKYKVHIRKRYLVENL